MQERKLQSEVKDCKERLRGNKKPAPRKPSASVVDRNVIREYLARARTSTPQGLTSASLEALPKVVGAVTSRKARKEMPNVIERVDDALDRVGVSDKAALRWAVIQVVASVLRA